MAWQCVGYNQPPHPSFFLGELEGITMAPPPLLLRGRTEVANGATIQTTGDHLLMSGYQDMTVSVADGASPYILTVNAPAWVQGSGSKQAVASTPKAPTRTIINYIYTLTGGAFSGATRLVKQGEGTLVLPNVVEKHTGKTDVWNGTLQFDGTMESSPVWLNRHTTLVSNGGQFMGGLTADYNATIYPGGQNAVGSIKASTLSLGFGSRVVFDVNGSQTDQLNATKLVVDTRDWSFGPKYKTPVFEFGGDVNNLAAGRYELGAVGSVEGSVSDILVEGITGKRFFLEHQDGKLYLVLEDMREATTVVWNGTAANNIWDLAETKNFINDGTSVYAAQGDDIVFDDNAQTGNVVVKGAVKPNSITFNNNTLAYTLTGDSILGGGTITKNGTGKVTINTENRTGATTINAGTLVVNALANLTGITYGALGNVSQKITINDGATLSVSQPVITDQPFNVSGNATLDVPANLTLTLNKGIKGSGSLVTKTGAGRLTLGTSNTFSRLAIKGGTVNAVAANNKDQLPATVEFQGGTLWADNNESTNIDNTANFVVPMGKTGTFYGGYRSTYKGSLTGEGTFNVYTGGVRCYFDGDWSQFAGKIKAFKENRQNKKSYDPIWAFRNTKGLPNATLEVQENVRVSNEGKDIVLGAVAGKGTLVGSGRWILGSNGKDFYLNTEVGITTARTDPYGGTIAKQASPVVKRGAGKMSMLTLGKLNGTLTIEEGTVSFNESKLATLVNGANATTVKANGRIVGQGLMQSLTLESGAELIPCGSVTNETTPGTIQTRSLMKVDKDATVNFLISATKHSKLLSNTFTMNGTVKVTFVNDYTPKLGDEYTLWTATSTFSGTPQWVLPELPEGLYWDASGLAQQTGVLRVTDDPSGISPIAASRQVTCEVYSLSGSKVMTLQTTKGETVSKVRKAGLRAGTFVMKINDGQHSEMRKIVVK